MEMTIKVKLDDSWEAYHATNEDRLKALLRDGLDGVEAVIIEEPKEKRNIFYNFITWYNSKPKVDKPKDGLISVNIIEDYLKL